MTEGNSWSNLVDVEVKLKVEVNVGAEVEFGVEVLSPVIPFYRKRTNC